MHMQWPPAAVVWLARLPTLPVVLRAGGLLVAELGPQQAWSLSTKDVSEWLLQPLTHKHRSSIADLLPDEAVGEPQHLVSHRCVCVCVCVLVLVRRRARGRLHGAHAHARTYSRKHTHTQFHMSMF